MREILFRGKSDLSGMWVEGYYIVREDEFGNKLYEIHELSGKKYVVDPKTVGQYIGVTDKNDNKIFEGDVCGGSWNTMFKILYDDVVLQFRAILPDGASREIVYYGHYGALRHYGSNIEIIGNIYDNPELLEV